MTWRLEIINMKKQAAQNHSHYDVSLPPALLVLQNPQGHPIKVPNTQAISCVAISVQPNPQWCFIGIQLPLGASWLGSKCVYGLSIFSVNSKIIQIGTPFFFPCSFWLWALHIHMQLLDITCLLPLLPFETSPNLDFFHHAELFETSRWWKKT